MHSAAYSWGGGGLEDEVYNPFQFKIHYVICFLETLLTPPPPKKTPDTPLKMVNRPTVFQIKIKPFRRTPSVVHGSSENLSAVVGSQTNVVFGAGFHGLSERTQFVGTFNRW